MSHVNITVRVGQQSYPLEQSVVLAQRRGLSTHPAGTPELPCALCLAPLPVDARTLALASDQAVPVVCVDCGYHVYPDMVVGTVGGETVTLRQAVDRGLVKKGEAPPS